ncbi:bacterial capsule synthesis protein [Treponema phagedenis F0421]|uniref:CapA family protein n=1 Tax=Treponema phagedenis TaxID=162 RepID=UPI0001F63785|nr:CapA family protein [Treponema phagedenis]EFW36906.1 bacterial capsule synthesis protein [Treponema phagedenis F0421]
MKKINTICVLTVLLLIFSCKSNETASEQDTEVSEQKPKIETLSLTFAGDLMAHDINYKMKNYDLIYDDLRQLLLSDDLSFINVETPVCASLPMSTYPCFNVHRSYLRAAISAGFDAFSFANNHTNDQKVKGIEGSIQSIQALQKEFSAASPTRLLYYTGLKNTVDEQLCPVMINHNGWKILFLSVTEILNSYDASMKRLNYSPPTKKGRAQLLENIKKMRKENPCDLFVLSLHLYEEEYKRTVLESKKKWFRQLAENGIDIVWAHHPHVMQEWTIAEIERTPLPTEQGKTEIPVEPKNCLFMYSMGNFISVQRVKVQYTNPDYYREYTGDAVVIQATFTKANGKIKKNIELKPFLITQYNHASGPIVKLFTKEWIETLPQKEKEYFLKRYELMHAYLPIKKNKQAARYKNNFRGDFITQ